jgi:Domain of unknown function (DUF4214)
MTPSNIDFITELYIGYYNRAPDPAGLEFWSKALDEGLSVTSIANEFAKSDESQKLYPFLAGARSFVTQVYNNVLNRDPDAAGLSFWTEQLLSGTVSPGTFIVTLEESVRMQLETDDAMTLANKVAVGKSYASRISVAGVTFDVPSAHETMEVITNNPASIAAGEAVIAKFIGT